MFSADSWHRKRTRQAMSIAWGVPSWSNCLKPATLTALKMAWQTRDLVTVPGEPQQEEPCGGEVDALPARSFHL